MAASLPVMIMTTRRHVSRHSFTTQHGTNFGNDMAMFNKDHWWCVEVIVSHNDGTVDKLKLKTRDDLNNVMGHVVCVENECHGNKECLDNLFSQLGTPQEKCANVRAQRTRKMTLECLGDQRRDTSRMMVEPKKRHMWSTLMMMI